MKNHQRLWLLLASVFSLATGSVNAVEQDKAWSISFDNDFLVPIARDQDYTYGLSFSKNDASILTTLGLDSALDFLSKPLAMQTQQADQSIEFGLYGFTPEDTSADGLIAGDRPFASLAYISGSQILHSPDPSVKWRSSLTLGVLGLPIAGSAQNEFHAWIGNERVKGWDNQISAGGEPTARFQLARQQLLAKTQHTELKTTANVSVGYLTEASVALNARIGNPKAHWKTVAPELSFYREQGVLGDFSAIANENYVLVGAAIKQRFYNAFLQGQFRDSAFSYNAGELNHTLLEAWLGYVHSFRQQFQLSYLVRAHSSELKQGVGNRTVVWGGVNITKQL